MHVSGHMKIKSGLLTDSSHVRVGVDPYHPTLVTLEVASPKYLITIALAGGDLARFRAMIDEAIAQGTQNVEPLHAALVAAS